MCIIQDDLDDWRREAAKMGSVYQDATLSLSIMDSDSSDEGFIYPLKEELEMDGKTVELGVRRRGSDSEIPLKEALGQSPLEERAWTLQERVLAPAVLHIAVDTMYWECCASFASQIAPDQNLHPPDHGLAVFQVRPLLRSSTETAPLGFWYRLLERYTFRELSYPSDRFAAIHGLAMQYERFTTSKYIAGLWSTDLHLGLWWVCNISRRKRLSGRPSWSPLTASGPIHYRDFRNLTRYAGELAHVTPKAEFEVSSHEATYGLGSSPPPFLRVRGSFKRGT